MGKVAVDIFEQKRLRRDFEKEQFSKSLNIVKKDDDWNELLFKLFEQIRFINEDLKGHIRI
jgi:hypothetical protein